MLDIAQLYGEEKGKNHGQITINNLEKELRR